MGGWFRIDVAFAEPMCGVPEEVESSSFLGFAGVRSTKIRIYPLETHIAEKLHAFTLPRKRANSRVKDIPDIALLASVREIEGAALCLAMDKVFAYRDTHSVPSLIPDPPVSWAPVYERIASRDELRWKSMAEVMGAVRQFLEPVLGGTPQWWRPDWWQWQGIQDD